MSASSGAFTLQAVAYFESGGLDEPGLRLLIYGDSIAGGWTRVSDNPTPDSPWHDLLKQELCGIAREVESCGVMGASTRLLLDNMDQEQLGLRAKRKEATNAIGKSYNAVILVAGTNDHLQLSGGCARPDSSRDPSRHA